jgi:hypothetical protein
MICSERGARGARGVRGVRGVRGARGATSEGPDTEQCGLHPRESGGASADSPVRKGSPMQRANDRSRPAPAPAHCDASVQRNRPWRHSWPRELALKMTAPECREGIGGCLAGVRNSEFGIRNAHEDGDGDVKTRPCLPILFEFRSGIRTCLLA